MDEKLIIKPMKSESMIEITDKVNLYAYVYPGDDQDNPRNVVLRIKLNDKFDVGLSLGPVISEKVLPHFLDEDGNLKC